MGLRPWPIPVLPIRGEGSLARRLTTVAFVAATVLAAHAPPQTGAGRPELGYLALVVVTAGAPGALALVPPPPPPPQTGAGRPELGYLALVVVTAVAWVAWTLLALDARATLGCLAVVAGAGGLLAVASDDRDGMAAALIFAAVATGTAAQAYSVGPAVGVAAIATAALLSDVVRTPA